MSIENLGMNDLAHASLNQSTSVSFDDFVIEDVKKGEEDSRQVATIHEPQPVITLSPRAQEHIDRLFCLLPPMALLSFLCIVNVAVLKITPYGSQPFWNLLPFPYSPNETSLNIFLQANANALALMCIVILVTVVFVLMFRFYMKRAMDLLVMVSTSFCFFGFLAYFLLTVIQPIDWITWTILCWNFMVPAIYFIFIIKEDDSVIGNIYLVVFSAILAWPFACFEEVTVLFFLIWMIIWDLIAVLTPCGPLRYALYIQQQRIWMAEDEFVLPRTMVYKARLYELGLGDLIFFGVIICRGASVNYVTAVSCICAMFTAVILTVLATVISKQTIPALPIALILGIVVYLSSRFSLSDFITEFNYRMIFF